MTPTEQDLARQLAEHPRWRWMAGMGIHVVSSDERDGPDRLIVADDRHWHAGGASDGRALWIRYRLSEMSRKRTPDLADPATQGCLLVMLAEAAGTIWVSNATTSYGPDGVEVLWSATTRSAARSRASDTLGEALARALLAAWGEA